MIADWRFDPFTESFNAATITEEDRIIPASSPYRVRLFEVPRQDSPSTVVPVILVQLNEDLDDSETGVDIVAGHYARVVVNDVILVDSEQMLVAGKPGSPTLTVTRGYGGTSAATHDNGTMMEILNSLTEITSGSPASREFRVDYKYHTALVLFHSGQGGYDVRFDYYGLGTPLYAGNVLPRGFIRGLRVEYKDADEIYIGSGTLHLHDGYNDIILRCSEKLTKQLSISSATGYEVRYIYVDPPASGWEITATDIEENSTPPVYDQEKHGWYHPTNTDQRFIGSVVIDDQTIMEFYRVSENEVLFSTVSDGLISNGSSTSWADITDLDRFCPNIDDAVALLWVEMRNTHTSIARDCRIRKNGSDDAGQFGGYAIGDSGGNESNSKYVRINVDSNGLAEYKMSNSDANVDINCMGYWEPR